MTTGYVTGQPVLEGLALEVPLTGITQLTGRNGSGKSTVAELVSGYLRPWSGTVEVVGHPAHSPAARNVRRVCRTTVSLYPHMTVRDHLVFASRCRGVAVDDELARADLYGLGPWMDQQARALSTGNARKLWLVFCTAGPFDVAFLDEPFNGLDTDTVEVAIAELRRWATTGAVVIASHLLPSDLAPDSVIELEPVTGTGGAARDLAQPVAGGSR